MRGAAAGSVLVIDWTVRSFSNMDNDLIRDLIAAGQHLGLIEI